MNEFDDDHHRGRRMAIRFALAGVPLIGGAGWLLVGPNLRDDTDPAAVVVETTAGATSSSLMFTASTETPAGTMIFTPVADAHVESASPNSNFGTATLLRADSDPAEEAFVRFDVNGTAGTVTSARLRVFAMNGTTSGSTVYRTGNAWAERGVTWDNRPSQLGAPADDLGAVATGMWAEFDVTPLVEGDGTVSFNISRTSPDAIHFNSREELDPSLRPQLVVTFSSDPPSSPAPSTSTRPSTSTSTTTEPTTTTSTTVAPTTTTSTTTSTTVAPTTTTSTTTSTTVASTTTTSTTTAPTTTMSTTTVAPTSSSTTTTTSPALVPIATGPTASTLPDGRPVSVVAVFGREQITLTGAVPTQAAADQLVAFAGVFRLTPATVINNLTVDPNVTVSGGIRVVELDSVHFVDESDVITPDQARELDRVVRVMTASPNLTLHVVGNTDQNGDPTRNYVISQRRAQAVVEYLVSHGIDRSRLTTQPAGESNPLSLEATIEADSINRRTDFVFFGILGG